MNSIEFSFFVDNDTFKRLEYFTMLDILMLLVWAVLIFGYAFYKKSKHPNVEYYNFFFKNLNFRIFFGLAYALVYMFYYGGGDTTAYWDLATCMNKLFWESPQFYFNNIFVGYNDVGFIYKYNLQTGYPPTWIMSEEEGFFTGKVVSLFSFVTGNSYLAITLVISAITANVTWRFYEMVRLWFPNPAKMFTYFVLFIPSVAFWCSGISKDTLVYISIISIITHGFVLLKGKQKRKIWHIIIILFHLWMIYKVRSVVLMVIFIPIFIAVSFKIANRFQSFIFMKRIVQILVAGISAGMFFVIMQFYGQQLSIDSYLKEAEVVQQDFANNNSYSGKKYTIEVSDYSFGGIIQSAPIAIVTGWFRPFLPEALSPTLLLNGFESTLLLYFVFVFFRKNSRTKIKMIWANEFLIFCLFFVLIYGFITGFSSIIFGVLVRLRAPLLPFLGILLTAYLVPKEKKLEEEDGEEFDTNTLRLDAGK